MIEMLKNAREDAEKEIGFITSDEFANNVLEYCKKKCVTIKKSPEYLPVLYRFELVLFAQMEAINLFYKLNRGEV